MMRSVESASSVFYHSQEEDPVKTSSDSQGSSAPPYDSCQDSMIDGGSATTDQEQLATGRRTSIVHLCLPITGSMPIF